MAGTSEAHNNLKNNNVLVLNIEVFQIKFS